VTTAAVAQVACLLDAGQLRTVRIGEVLLLEEAVRAHRMLEGEPHGRGKIVLRVAAAG